MAHSIWRRLTRGGAPVLRLGAPMVAYYLVQNLASLACLALLGRLGTATLAGFGAAGAILGVVLALLYGFDTAVQTLVSRATGAGEKDRIGQRLGEALATSAPLGLVLAILLWRFGPPLVAGMLTDAAAANAGGVYLRAWAPSLALLALTIPINAAWIGVGRPAIAFLVTLLTAPAQAAMTLLLVFGAGPIAAQGIAGAGAASVIACLFGAGLQAALVSGLRLTERWRSPSWPGILRIVAIGWPVSLQQSFASLGLMIAYAIVAQLGSGGAAVINVLLSLTLLTVQTAIGLGVAAATLVGHSLGRGDVDEARAWGWRAMRIGVLMTGPLGLVAAVEPEPLLRLFLHDPQTLALAMLPARLAGAGVAADTVTWVLCFALRGAGATKLASGAPFARLWLIQLPLMWWVGLGLRQGVLGIVAVQTALTVVEALVLAAVWASRFWIPDGIVARRANVPAEIRRIAILGGAGAGKSTMARQVGPLVGAPVIHLDRLVFDPGWSRNPPDVIRERLAPMLGDRWVVEGTYGEASALTLPVADLVIWLEQPAWLRLWRAWRKTRDHRGKPRADRPDGCEEGFGWPYAQTVLSFGGWSPDVERRLKRLGANDVLRLRGDREAMRFLAGLDQPQLSTAPTRRAATGLLREAG